MLKQIRETQGKMTTIRRRRRRCLDFAYGRQWGDTIRTGTGQVMSEGAWMRRRGRTPITNNLIRRAVKNAIGYWEQQANRPETDPLKSTDIRTLEELIISGIAVQRIGAPDDPLLPDVRLISPERFFCNNFDNPTLLGAEYSLPLSMVMNIFAGGDADKAIQIAALSDTRNGNEITVTEVWHKAEISALHWHDPLHAMHCHTSLTPTHLDDLKRLSNHRLQMGKPELKIRFESRMQWEQLWLTDHGEILQRTVYTDADANPYLVAIYPALDGQVHSPVEDLIEQQKQINSLITTLSSVIDHSAKGVLMFPTDQLPRGMTWKEVRKLWENPGSILPFNPTRKGLYPTQMSAPGSMEGAMQLLQLQMKIFYEMAGINNTIEETSHQYSINSEALKEGMEQSRMVLRELHATFNDLLQRRHNRLHRTT